MRRMIPSLIGVMVLAIGTTAMADQTDDEIAALAARARKTIARIHERPMTSERMTPWVIMHAVIAYEQDLQVYDEQAKEKVDAITYLNQRARWQEKPIYRVVDGVPTLPTRGLSFGLRESFVVQDHVDQFLMAFADAAVPLTAKITAEGGKEFTLADMLAASQKKFQPKQELGWTLLVYTHYLGLDAEWTNSKDEKYTLEDLLALALKRDPRHETEGGPHHLYGIGFALEAHQSENPGELTGVWADARKYLDEYVAISKKNQQADGTFSATMFRPPIRGRDARQNVWATGHTIEWLTIVLPPETLREPWMTRSVTALLDILDKASYDELSEGGLYHAVHALRRYADSVDPPS